MSPESLVTATSERYGPWAGIASLLAMGVIYYLLRELHRERDENRRLNLELRETQSRCTETVLKLSYRFRETIAALTQWGPRKGS